MKGRASFLEISETNHASLMEYVARLRSAGLKLPAHGGTVNKTAVARACGFPREVFQQNPRFATTLKGAVAELGLDRSEQVEEPVSRNPEDKARILRLEQQLAACRSELLDLRRRLRRYEAIAEHVGTTGRRVVP